MTLGLVVWLMAAGFAGATTRYAVTRGLEAALGSHYPFGTTIVNLIGAMGGGVAAGLGVPPGESMAVTVVALGFFGSLTTFSTWMVETLEMWRRGARVLAFSHVVGGLAFGTAAAWLGFRLTT